MSGRAHRPDIGRRAARLAGRRLAAADRASRARRVRPGVAAPVRAGGSAHPRGAGRHGGADRTHGLDVGPRSRGETDRRHRARRTRLGRRAGVRPRARGRGLRPPHPRARLVRAPRPQGNRPEGERPRLPARLPRGRAHAALPRPPAPRCRRPPAVRTDEARARAARLEVRPALRGCEKQRGRGDPRAGRRRVRRLALALLAGVATWLAAAALDGRAGAASCTDAFPNGLGLTGSAQQLVTVVAPAPTSTRGEVDVGGWVGGWWTRTGGPGRAWLGGRGVSADRKEGARTTPAGVFGFGSAIYGVAPNPGVH